MLGNNGSQIYCVYNTTRESFLSLNVARADSHFARLKGLLGVMRLKCDEGIWLTPSYGIHSVGLRFAIDLIYLDVGDRVIDTIESYGRFRIGPLRMSCASVLELPTRTIYHSQTRTGDQLLIVRPEEIEHYLKPGEVRNEAKPDPKKRYEPTAT